MSGIAAPDERASFSNIIFIPNEFKKEQGRTPDLKETDFRKVSFRNTKFNSIRFINCTFDYCLFMSAEFINCEIINCKFTNTNTNKSKFISTLVEPNDFKKNFDYKSDTNIAANLYHELYKNLANEHQPERANRSLYLLYRAENAHLKSQLNRKVIGKFKYFSSKAWHFFQNYISGYGLHKYKIYIWLFSTLLVSSTINYVFRDHFFEPCTLETKLDAFYFTIVTLTTLGYGDIYPVTQVGKGVVMGETIIGIIFISQFLSLLSERKV